jgi:hypothetical protein
MGLLQVAKTAVVGCKIALVANTGAEDVIVLGALTRCGLF